MDRNELHKWMCCFGPPTVFSSPRPRIQLYAMIRRCFRQQCTRTFSQSIAAQDESMQSGVMTTAVFLPNLKLAEGASKSPSGPSYADDWPPMTSSYAFYDFTGQSCATNAKIYSLLPFMQLTHLLLIKQIVPRRELRLHEGQTDLCWSITALVQRVPHDVEPFSQSES